jgi:hypothetical protein
MSYFKSGTYNRECDDCGKVFKRDTMHKSWDNFIICSYCKEERNEFKGNIRKHSKMRID